VITSPVCLTWLAHHNPPVLQDTFGPSAWLIWVRGALYAIGILAFYTALDYIPLSDLVAIYHIKPFIVIALFRVVMGERITWVQGVSCGESNTPLVFGRSCAGCPEGLMTSHLAWRGASGRSSRGTVRRARSPAGFGTCELPGGVAGLGLAGSDDGARCRGR
jgi:hypothetical protein